MAVLLTHKPKLLNEIKHLIISLVERTPNEKQYNVTDDLKPFLEELTTERSLLLTSSPIHIMLEIKAHTRQVVSIANQLGNILDERDIIALTTLVESYFINEMMMARKLNKTVA